MDKYCNKKRSGKGRKKNHKFISRKRDGVIDIIKSQVKEIHFINMPIHF